MINNLLRAHIYAILVIGTFLGLIPIGLISVLGINTFNIAYLSASSLALIGCSVAALGGALSYSCMLLFVVKGKGTAFPTDPPNAFVAIGPYVYSRNPMYIGNLILALGIGIFLGSKTYLFYTFVLSVVIHFYIILHEEPRLIKRFGESYIVYCQNTKRWIPGLF